MKRGQPCLGTFLLKDEQADSDVITDINLVHPVGVFAQFTIVFSAASGPWKECEKEEGLTAAQYPNRRVKTTDLVKAGGSQLLGSRTTLNRPSLLTKSSCPRFCLLPRRLILSCQRTRPGTIRACQHRVPSPISTYSFLQRFFHTSFLRDYGVSIVNIANLLTQPYNKDDQYIRTFIAEAVSVFEDIAQLNLLFCDQITNFSINRVATLLPQSPQLKLSGRLGVLRHRQFLREALLVLKKQVIDAQLQSKLSRDEDSKIVKRQREYYHMEQLKKVLGL